MITDIKEIEIYNVKDINLIYFYKKAFQNKKADSYYTGLKVTYQDSTKTLEYDYKSPYYRLFCQQVLSLYVKEKNDREIILLGDFTISIINHYDCIKDNKLDFEIPSLCREQMPRNDKFLELFQTVEPFFMEALKQIFYCFYPQKQLEIDSVKHLRNRYMFHVSHPIDKYIPFTISNKNNMFFVKTQLLEDQKILPIEISIENRLDQIKTYWHLEDYDLNGHMITMIQNDMISYESAVVSDGTTILLEKDKVELIEEPSIRQKILFYLELSHINIDDTNIYKLSTDIEQYAIVDSSMNEMEEKKSCVLICFRDDCVKIEMRKEISFHDLQNHIDVVLDDVRFIDTYTLKTNQNNSVLKKRRKFQDSIYLKRMNQDTEKKFDYETFELPHYDSIGQIDYSEYNDFSKIYGKKVK